MKHHYKKLNAEKEKLAEKERLYDMQLKNLKSLLDKKELLGEVVFRQEYILLVT